jgi:hypothetical protein
VLLQKGKVSLGLGSVELTSVIHFFDRQLSDTMNQIGQLALQKPAPQWNGTAVIDGQFKEISLADYKGKYLVFFFYPLDL